MNPGATRLVLQTEGLLEKATQQNVNPGSAVIIQGVDGLAPDEARAGIERMALGLGLSRWLEPWLPVEGMDFGLSYQWQSREPAAGPTVADGLLNGRLSWRW